MKLTIRDVAALLNVSERTIYRRIDLAVIPAYRINEQWRFNRAELLAWATGRRLNASSELLQEPETMGAVAPSFTETLSAGGIFYRVAGEERTSALRAIVELSRLPDDVDRGWVFDMLLARESLGSKPCVQRGSETESRSHTREAATTLGPGLPDAESGVVVI